MGLQIRILDPSIQAGCCDPLVMKRTAPMIRAAQAMLCAGTLLAGCKPQEASSTPQTPETAAVHASLEDFKGQPTEENLKRVEADLAKLQVEIRELDVQVSNASGAEKSETQAKLDGLRAKNNAYRAEFAAARVSATVNKAGDAAEKAAEKTGEAAKDAAQAVQDTFNTQEKP